MSKEAEALEAAIGDCNKAIGRGDWGAESLLRCLHVRGYAVTFIGEDPDQASFKAVRDAE